MGSSEPSLIPEWLRYNGSSTRNFRASYHSASSGSKTDAASLANCSRNKSFRSSGEFESPRSVLDRSSSTDSRRSSGSSGTSENVYSSFNRSNREKERVKERSAFGISRVRDCDDSSGRDNLRRSRSMVSRKQEDLFPRRVASDMTGCEKSSPSNISIYHGGDHTGQSMKTTFFEKNFPMLLVDEKQEVPPITRVASPVLTAATQGVPIGSSALVGEGWSALAEVPAVAGAKNLESPHAHQPADTASASEASSHVSGLNMVEMLLQTPFIACTASQLSSEAQKLEQMAIKQSRQLIPMTPVMLKSSVLSSGDKLKPKTSLKNGELSSISRNGLHAQPSSSSHLTSQSLRGVSVAPESMNATQVGRFHVLKRPWESGTSPASKGGFGSAKNVGNTQPPNTLVTTVGSSASLRTPHNSRTYPMERKAVGLSLHGPASLEKKLISSHARSRHAFFNSMRNKASVKASISSETICTASLCVEQPSEVDKETATVSENGHSICNGGPAQETQKVSTGECYSVSVNEVIPDEEEEAAFMRSLGWEENGGEDDLLTEEEINNFYQEVMKLRPALNLCETMQQPNVSLLHALSVGGGLSRLTSSEAVLKLN